MTRAQALLAFQGLYQAYAECARRHAGLVRSWPE